MRNSDSKKSIGTVKEIYDLIDSLSPFELQKKWDNSGLNIGSYSSAFKNIYLTLDVTMDIAESIEPDSLIISHHPLIFSPIKSLNFEEYPANITQKLVLKNCSLISAHTNFDATHLNRYFASDILGFKDGVEDDDMIRCKIEKVGFEEFANRIKKILKTETLKATKSSQYVENVYIICGSGAAYIEKIKDRENSLLITGDVKHHDAISAISLGVSIIDAGHHGSEKYFGEIVETILQKSGYKAIISNSTNPFSYK